MNETNICTPLEAVLSGQKAVADSEKDTIEILGCKLQATTSFERNHIS